MAFRVEYVADFNFPPGFKLYGGVMPDRKYLKTGKWLVVATGNYPALSDSFGVYAFEWDGGTTIARLVAYTAHPFNRITNARGSLESAEGIVFIWAVDSDRLKIFRVIGAVPTEDDENTIME